MIYIRRAIYFLHINSIRNIQLFEITYVALSFETWITEPNRHDATPKKTGILATHLSDPQI